MNLRDAFYTSYSLSRGAPSASWVLPQVDGTIQLAERVGFEPTDAFTSPVFKTGAFNRSAISPDNESAPNSQTQVLYYHMCPIFVNRNFKFFALQCAEPKCIPATRAKIPSIPATLLIFRVFGSSGSGKSGAQPLQAHLSYEAAASLSAAA